MILLITVFDRLKAQALTMASYVHLLLYCALAEILRRFIFALVEAYTSPLAKVPGPWFRRISHLPYKIAIIQDKPALVYAKLMKKYGNTVVIVLVSGIDAVHRVIVEEDWPKSELYRALRARKDVADLVTETDKAISKCAEGEDGSAVIDIMRVSLNLATDILSATSLGGSFEQTSNNGTRWMELIVARIRRAILYAHFPLLRHLPFMPTVESTELTEMLDTVLSNRRNDPDMESKKDLLQTVLNTNKAVPHIYTEEHLKEDLRLFMVAGSESTSAVATFGILLLLNNPAKLETLLDEINQTFPSADSDITIEKTKDLTYLTAVINEAMRVMPVTPTGVRRETRIATTLNGYQIPAGTTVSAQITTVGFDPDRWPDASSFIPERWIGQYKGVEADRKSFLPFSGGSRTCPGQYFAMRELRLLKTPDRSGIPLVKKQKNEVFPQTMARGSQEYPDSPFQLQSSRGKITILPIKYFRELDTLPESQSSRVGALKSRNQNALDSLSWLESFLKNSPTIFRRTFSREFVFGAVKSELLPSMEASIGTPAEKTAFPLWVLCDELSIRIGSRYWFGVSAPKTDDWVSAYRGARKSVISATITTFLFPKLLLPLARPLLYWFDRKFICFKNQLKEMARITADQCGDSLFEPAIKDTVPLYHNMVRYLRSDNLEEDLDREIQSQFHATLFFFSTLTENLTQLLIDLAMNPEHVDELREELESVSSGDLPTLQSLGELKKLDSFLKESQRFNSLIMSEILTPISTIPKGTEVSFNLDQINADNKLWDEPEKFKPWRFCDLNKSRTATRSYDFVTTGTDQPNFGLSWVFRLE
ncbi:cytochrome P450 monooxygenase [Fusarium phyllophilum]|uniref:Cytochrome P450 monooxygenase n=1 Tax=Fusarium phyllophilum TaxID=47803 RepID=A0A8H5I8W0_9HYPO|nr:cytochrome P450 monooxygenase [Fusarium phyllophilum]